MPTHHSSSSAYAPDLASRFFAAVDELSLAPLLNYTPHLEDPYLSSSDLKPSRHQRFAQDDESVPRPAAIFEQPSVSTPLSTTQPDEPTDAPLIYSTLLVLTLIALAIAPILIAGVFLAMIVFSAAPAGDAWISLVLTFVTPAWLGCPIHQWIVNHFYPA